MQDLEWKGSVPQRFSGGRKHIEAPNQIGTGLSFSQPKTLNAGIRTFSLSPTPEATFKPHQRVYEDKYYSQAKDLDYRGIKRVELPPQEQRIRPERLHINRGQQTDKQLEYRGIRSFHESNKTRDNHYFVENVMQRKGKMYGLESMRNSIGISSLGDKPYRYPEYEPDFYKNGGLIPGSTQKPRRGETVAVIKPGSMFTKPMWDVRVKMDELIEERKYMDSIDEWEQTILKQNNPNWRDPDAEPSEPVGSKDAKKAGKK